MSRLHTWIPIIALALLSTSCLVNSSNRRTSKASPGPDAIVAVLTDFHDAASKADGSRYFAHMTADAVFIGTDAAERWTKPEFQAYAKPYFEEGKGWTYTAIAGRRFVTIAPDGNTAWFDEALLNEKYGECRGSGVLVREAEKWRIAQYNLTVPIPNDLMEDVAKQIKTHLTKPPAVGG